MRKKLTAALLIFMLLLSACGRGGEVTAPPENMEAEGEGAQAQAVPAEEAKLSAAYVPREIAFPPELKKCDFWASLGDSLWFAGRDSEGGFLLAEYDTISGSWRSLPLDAGEAHRPEIRSFSMADSSFWLLLAESRNQEDVENGLSLEELGYYVLSGSIDGEQSCVRVPFEGGDSTETSMLTFSSLLALDSNRALLSTESSFFEVDRQLNILSQPEPDAEGYGAKLKIDDETWMQNRSGAWAPLDTASLSLDMSRSIEAERLNSSSNAGHFLCLGDGALYAYDPATGEKTEIFKYIDVALNLESLSSFTFFENSRGIFFYRQSSSLVEVSPKLVRERQTLRLLCFGNAGTDAYQYSLTGYDYSDAMMDAVIRFNNTDPEYRVEIVSWVYEDEAELDRLLIELSRTEDIDLVDTSFLPEGAVDAGLFTDLLPYLDSDAELSREDFIQPLLNGMIYKGGLYQYTARFSMISMAASDKLFPGRENWTSQAVMDIAGKYGAMPGVDREKLSSLFQQAATAEFIDWENMSCDFESPAFINWLELLSKLAAEEGGEGLHPLTMISDMAADAGTMLRNPFGPEQDFSFVAAGFPDTEGTGSYFIPMSRETERFNVSLSTWGKNASAGILASSPNKEAAWRFVRCLMLSGGTDKTDGIPPLKASFEAVLESSIDYEDGNSESSSFSPEDAQMLRQQVYGDSKLAHLDPALLDILDREFTAFLEGGSTAQDCAGQIQSRVSLYLAENAD